MTRFLLPLLLLTAAPLAANTLKQQKGPATLELHFQGETQRLGLADLLAVTLTVEGHESMRVNAPKELAAAAPWHLVERSEPRRDPIGNDRVRWQLRYQFAPREPGKKIPFAFPEVVLREKEDEDQSIKFDPVDCEVITSIADADRGELRDITAIETMPEIPTAEFDWRWLVFAGCILALMVSTYVIRLVLKRRRLRSHAQIALYEWQRLAGLKLVEQDRSERFITLLTMLVRRYLERQFGIAARRQTTPEFVLQLAQHRGLSSEEKAFLAEFLECSDAVKFANQVMSSDECRKWSDAVKQFLETRAKS